MMKKFNSFAVLTAILASAFTACTETEEIAKADQKALDFSVFANKTTRAAETAGSLKTDGKSFGVWGYSTYDGSKTTVFLNQQITYSLANDAWEYSPLKFWDKESSYEFYAYYPHSTSNAAISNTGEISITDFTVAPAVADQVDLMIANKVDRSIGTISDVVFNFNHILSNINLTFKKSTNLNNVKVTLKSVKLYGMISKGSFVQTATTAPTGTWTCSTTPGDVITSGTAIELANENIVTASATATQFTDMLLIPQSTDDLKLDIEYFLGNEDSSNPNNNGQTFYRTLLLDNATHTNYPDEWEQNQKITYNFTIDANVILFDDPTVIDWAPETNADVPVE